MKFDDVFKRGTKNYEVILGYNENNELLKINLNENPSMIITGSTGTSKSILLHEILLQLIQKNSSKNLKIIPIALTRVELLPYSNTDYSFCPVTNSMDKIYSSFEKVENMIVARKKLLLKNELKDFESYNKKFEDSQLNYIVIAIDEASEILEDEKAKNMLFNIVDSCDKLGIYIIANTSNVYNDFFKDNLNLNFACEISFDYVSEDEALLNNIDQSQNLIGKNFIIKFKNKKNQAEYNSIEFNDTYLEEILNK